MYVTPLDPKRLCCIVRQSLALAGSNLRSEYWRQEVSPRLLTREGRVHREDTFLDVALKLVFVEVFLEFCAAK